jgi:hypothetical protein
LIKVPRDKPIAGFEPEPPVDPQPGAFRAGSLFDISVIHKPQHTTNSVKTSFNPRKQ